MDSNGYNDSEFRTNLNGLKHIMGGKDRVMDNQISLLQVYDGEDIEELELQAKLISEYANKKRKAKKAWENAFQRWSDNHGMSCDNTESYGCCGYGSMCDWCYDDPSIGRPCVRALNAMCREKEIDIDYSERNFERIWSEL